MPVRGRTKDPGILFVTKFIIAGDGTGEAGLRITYPIYQSR